MKKMTLLGIIVLLVYGNCRSDEPVSPSDIKLPALTLKGNGIFGCFIDDKPWLNAGYRKNTDGNLNAYFYYSKKSDSTSLNITGYKFSTAENDDLRLQFGFKGFPKIGEVYTIGITPKLLFRVSYSPTLRITSDVVSYSAPFSTANLMNSANISFVKVDTVSRIISGVFYSKLYPDSNPISTPKISTQGRFDVTYR
jgi:hypothetical protein